MWVDTLQDHYLSRLTSILVNPGEVRADKKIPVDPGLEKRVSGLLRLSVYAIQRIDLANDILSSWKYLLPMNDEQHASSPLRSLDRHIGDGLWRIVSQVDGLSNLNDDGWVSAAAPRAGQRGERGLAAPGLATGRRRTRPRVCRTAREATAGAGAPTWANSRCRPSSMSPSWRSMSPSANSTSVEGGVTG